MPSLVSVPERHMVEGDGNQLDIKRNSQIDSSSKNDIIIGGSTTAVKSKIPETDNNNEELSVAEIQQKTDDCDGSRSSNMSMTNQTADATSLSLKIATVSSGDKPLKILNNTALGSAEKIDESNIMSSSHTSPLNKKRRVTPNEDSGSKQNQQNKVNQMTLSSFFFKGKNKATVSTPPKTGNNKTINSRVENGTTKSTNILSSRKRPHADEISPTTDSRRNDEIETINIDDDNDNDNDQGNIKEEKSTEKGLTEENNPTSDGDTGGNVDLEKVKQKVPLSDSIVSASKDMCSFSINVPVVSTMANTATTAQTTSTKNINILTPLARKKRGPSTPATAGKNKKKATPKAVKTTSARKPKQSISKKSKTPESFTAPKTLSIEELPEERRTLIHQHNAMKGRYLARASELVTRYRDGTDEENDFGMIYLQPVTDENELKLLNTTNKCEEFPAQIVTNMALLIEGSDLPLSGLVSKICAELKAKHGTTWSSEAVCAKIKLLSKRKAYFDVAIKCTIKVVDVFEDDDRDRLWRWEITTLEIVNSEFVSKARTARTARKKISSYHSALLRLVKSIEDAEKQIVNPTLPKLNNAIAKISCDEEKVLRFERDAEKQRLAEQVKARKLLEQDAKRKSKEEAAEEKRRKREDAAEKKKEAARAREEEKHKKEEERDRKDEEKKMQEKMKLKKMTKQKASFRSFFAAPKKVVPIQKKAVVTNIAAATCQAFDTKIFRAKINASNDVLNLVLNQQKRSASAFACRKRRTKKVAVSVYKTVAPEEDGGWDAPSYLEQQTIKIPNKYRFLSFHEDRRPAYHGTWSKKSSIITGKKPFGKDTFVFDYEYDSEGEWEEGDDEMGEDVEDDSKNQEDEEAEDAEGNAKVYDFDDGFCVADDRLHDNEEDADEDIKALYKKKMLNREREQHNHTNRISIIAPGPGGIPLHMADNKYISTDRFEGLRQNNVADILPSYKGITLCDIKLSLDAFPQLHLNEENRVETTSNGNANKDDYTVEDMIKMARFTHHSTLNSKDKLIEELRRTHPTVFSIRAKATRKLDAIAVKKKHPQYTGVCVYWEVKTEILTELGLTDILEKKLEEKVTPKDEVTPSSGDRESKSSTGVNERKRKTPKKLSQDQTNSTKKKKKTVNSDGKAAKATAGSIPRSNGKKDSPKKKDDDVNIGMKNLMAQFVKKGPPEKNSSKSVDASTISTTGKDTKASFSSSSE